MCSSPIFIPRVEVSNKSLLCITCVRALWNKCCKELYWRQTGTEIIVTFMSKDVCNLFFFLLSFSIFCHQIRQVSATVEYIHLSGWLDSDLACSFTGKCRLLHNIMTGLKRFHFIPSPRDGGTSSSSRHWTWHGNWTRVLRYWERLIGQRITRSWSKLIG